MMCKNRNELFDLEPGEEWECDLDRRGFERMRDLILDPNGARGAAARLPRTDEPEEEPRGGDAYAGGGFG